VFFIEIANIANIAKYPKWINGNLAISFFSKRLFSRLLFPVFYNKRTVNVFYCPFIFVSLRLDFTY